MSRQQPTGAPTDAIVVGIGLDGAEAALAFAVDEARRTRSRLHLLHVLHLSAGEAYAGVYQGAVEAADAAVAAALARAQVLAEDDVPVTVERLDDGAIQADLLERAAPARMLVLQHRRLGRLQRLMTGSTVSGVATRCPVPLVSVPEDWRPDPQTPAVVTVGVQDASEAPALVRRAAIEARLHGGRVEVLHTWWLYGGYDGALADAAFCEEQERRMTRELGSVVDAARVERPDVPIHLSVRHEPPVDALLEAAADSRLLVLGRRHHLLPIGSHLGPVVRAVLHESHGPVLLDPEAPRGVRVAAGEDQPTAALVGQPV